MERRRGGSSRRYKNRIGSSTEEYRDSNMVIPFEGNS